jgi:hypothetical protein
MPTTSNRGRYFEIRSVGTDFKAGTHCVEKLSRQN